MTLSFNYKQIDRPDPYLSESVPAIPVTLIGEKEKIDIIGILDSGADYTIIPVDMAEILGLDLSVPPENIGGIGGDVKAIPTKLRIKIGNDREAYSFWVNIYAILDEMKDEFPILIGRADFFENFKITFHESKRKIHLKRDT